MSVSSSSDLPYSDDDDDKPQWPVRAKPTTGTFGNSVKLTQFTKGDSIDGGMYQGVHTVNYVGYIRVSQYTTVYYSIWQYTTVYCTNDDSSSEHV